MVEKFFFGGNRGQRAGRELLRRPVSLWQGFEFLRKEGRAELK
jgi:hypothetical protein